MHRVKRTTSNEPVLPAFIIWTLFFILLTLKLIEVGPVADWSWWWVFSPIWGCFAFVAFVFLVFYICSVLCKVWDRLRGTSNKKNEKRPCVKKQSIK